MYVFHFRKMYSQVKFENKIILFKLLKIILFKIRKRIIKNLFFTHYFFVDYVITFNHILYRSDWL